MLLTEYEEDKDTIFEKKDDYIFQEKFNGVRCMLHIKNGKVSAIRNRTDNPVLQLYPEVANITFDWTTTAIIDGEMCQIRDGKSYFYGGIDQRHKKLHDDRKEKFPVTFVAFDVIYLNGKMLTDLSYEERYKELEKILPTAENIILSKNIDDPKEFWNTEIVARNKEGLVAKLKTAKYELGIRSKNYLKLKYYKCAKVIVDKVEDNPKGQKIYGHTKVEDQEILVECQFSGKNMDIKDGQELNVEYLDTYNGKMIQPHKIKGEVIE